MADNWGSTMLEPRDAHDDYAYGPYDDARDRRIAELESTIDKIHMYALKCKHSKQDMNHDTVLIFLDAAGHGEGE